MCHTFDTQLNCHGIFLGFQVRVLSFLGFLMRNDFLGQGMGHGAIAGVTGMRLKQKGRLWHEWRKCKVRSRRFGVMCCMTCEYFESHSGVSVVCDSDE